MFDCITKSSSLVEVVDTSVRERPGAAVATTATRVTEVVALSHRVARGGECRIVQRHDPLSSAGCKHKCLSSTARNRRRSTAIESGLGIEVGRCWRLRRAGRPAAYQRRLVRGGDLRSDRWVMAGPAAALMADAMAPYLTWIVAHAGSAASAYETALATMVSPPVIAVDREYLASLVTTNFLGQSTPENAVTEFHYRHMWAHNVEAICCYASSSAATCRLTPFSAPAVEFTSAVTPASGGASATTDTPPMMAADPRLLCAVPAAPNQLESPAVSSFGWDLSTSSSLRNEVVSGFPSACSGIIFCLAGNVGGGWWCGWRALSGEGLSRVSAGAVWQHPCGLDEPTL
jgi:PPE-repeat protein